MIPTYRLVLSTHDVRLLLLLIRERHAVVTEWEPHERAAFQRMQLDLERELERRP
jgi:hypothetical protein